MALTISSLKHIDTYTIYDIEGMVRAKTTKHMKNKQRQEMPKAKQGKFN